MNRVRVTAASAALFLLVGSGQVIADGHEKAEADFTPIELWACNFEDGMGPDDLDAVNAKWNAAMDEAGATDYFAALMYPNFHNDIGFDVAWIGGWRDGNAMGVGMDSSLDDEDELSAGYDAVLDCPGHSLFASARMKDPGESGEDDGEFVLSFADCSIGEGKTMDDVRAAQEAWNAYADEHGFKGGTWYFWPVWGAPQDLDYDFKIVGSAPNYTTVGSNFQLMAEGHWRNSQEIWGDALDCDSNRVYTTEMVRSMADDDE
jgi:hypothetical protein